MTIAVSGTRLRRSPEPVAPPGSAIAMAKQTDKVVTAMFVDKDQRLAVAWLNPDDNDGHWHLPQAISGAVAPPGSAVALAKQTDSVLTAMLVGHDRKLQVAWLDLAAGSWHVPQPIAGVLAPPGAAVALGKQSDEVFAALVVGDDRRLQVASLDLSEGQPWLWPQTDLSRGGARRRPGDHGQAVAVAPRVGEQLHIKQAPFRRWWEETVPEAQSRSSFLIMARTRRSVFDHTR